MIQVKAPGKLYIAGEYAVTEPGATNLFLLQSTDLLRQSNRSL